MSPPPLIWTNQRACFLFFLEINSALGKKKRRASKIALKEEGGVTFGSMWTLLAREWLLCHLGLQKEERERDSFAGMGERESQSIAD